MVRAYRKSVAKGKSRTVWAAVTANNKCPAERFLDELEKIKVRRGKSNARAEFLVLFQWLANHGEQNMPPKAFKSEQGKLYAFRRELNNVQYRFPCFKDGSDWIITHGFKKRGATKGKGKWPSNETDRANRIMREYYDCIAKLRS